MPILHSTPACAYSSSPGHKHCTAGPHRRLVMQQDFSCQTLHHLTRQSGSRTLLPLRAHRNGRESSTRFPITGDGRSNTDRHASRPSSAPFGSQPVAADLATRRCKARASSEGEVRRPSYDGPRPPLQRQRPGPQRPMDARQQQQSQGPAYAPSSSSNAQQRPQSYPQQSTTLQRPQRPGQQQQQSVQQRQPEPPARGGFGRQHAVVHFCLQYHTNYGQRIRLVGSHDNLGECMLRLSMQACSLPLDAPCMPVASATLLYKWDIHAFTSRYRKRATAKLHAWCACLHAQVADCLHAGLQVPGSCGMAWTCAGPTATTGWRMWSCREAACTSTSTCCWTRTAGRR